MKRTIAIGFLGVLVTMRASQREDRDRGRTIVAQAAIRNAFYKTQDFLEFAPDVRRAYATGLVEGMYLAPLFGAPERNKLLISLETCLAGMTDSQVAAIVDKYIREHPENWHWQLHTAGFAAMRQACVTR